MATHSSVFAWRIPGTVEPGGLLSMGLHRVRHDWGNLTAAALKHCSLGYMLKTPESSMNRTGGWLSLPDILICLLWGVLIPSRVIVQSLQSCQTLCNPIDCSPLGSTVHGILQARTLGWVAISSSSRFSPPRDQACSSASPRSPTLQTDSSPLSYQGSPRGTVTRSKVWDHCSKRPCYSWSALTWTHFLTLVHLTFNTYL